MDNNVVNHQSKKSTCESDTLDAQIELAKSQKVDGFNRKIKKAVRQEMISKEGDSR